MQSFYLIRHGETDWNIKLGRLQGHTDIPLNEKGLRQAKTLKTLTAPLGVEKVISSDLRRAFQTAQQMNSKQEILETTPLLREVNLGVGEGLTWEEIQGKLGPDFRALWSTNSEHSLDLRFPEGESRREVLQRVQNYLLSALQKNTGKTLAFVTHGFVIRTMVYHLAPGLEGFFVPNCAVVPFRYSLGRLHYAGPHRPEELLQPRMED